jgi:hypothetical protein
MAFFHKDQTAIDYKNHIITCQLSLSPDLKRFVPSATVSWRNNGRVLVHFLRSEKECTSGEDANSAALEEAKQWIDQRSNAFK